MKDTYKSMKKELIRDAHDAANTAIKHHIIDEYEDDEDTRAIISESIAKFAFFNAYLDFTIRDNNGEKVVNLQIKQCTERVKLPAGTLKATFTLNWKTFSFNNFEVESKLCLLLSIFHKDLTITVLDLFGENGFMLKI